MFGQKMKKNMLEGERMQINVVKELLINRYIETETENYFLSYDT